MFVIVATTRTDISACKPKEKLFRILGSFGCQDLPPPPHVNSPKEKHLTPRRVFLKPHTFPPVCRHP